MAYNRQQLQVPAVPNLPVPSVAYSRDFQSQNNGILKIFFIKLMNAFSSLTGLAGGRYIDNPNGLFFSTTDQTLAASNTGYPITFATTYLDRHVSVVDSSKITVVYGGIYNFQFSGQVKSTNSSSKDVFLWIKRSGTTIGYTTHQYTLGGSDNHMIVNWNFNIDMADGDYIQLYWAASDTNVTLETTAATSPHPGIPSAVVAVTFVAALPDVIPTPP